MNNSHSPQYTMAKRLLLTAIFSAFTVGAVAHADTTYGPIRPGETLSSIVNENYIVSPFSDLVIMREVFRLNPKAFINNNIGLVKQGVKLTLPSDESIAVVLARRGTSPPTQISPPANVSTRQLESKLKAVRAERDRANRTIRRLESESVELKRRVLILESANRELSDEIKTLDAALERTSSELASSQSKSVQASSTDQVALASERDEKIKALESSITDLQQSHKEELAQLKSTLDQNDDAKQATEDKLEALTKSAGQLETQIANLKSKNESLVVELAESRNAYEELRSSRSRNAKTDTTTSAAQPELITSSQSSKVNKQGFSAQLEKPITFPFWVLLLGGFALALTTLLMFLSRGKAKRAIAGLAEVRSEVATEDDSLVFHGANPEKIDPDIESLRVPPRRDPFRVAIIDPSMNDTVSDSLVYAVKNETNCLESDQLEVELKLAMVEAYAELGDRQAANELLTEIKKEGSQRQLATAELLANRLAE